MHHKHHLLNSSTLPTISSIRDTAIRRVDKEAEATEDADANAAVAVAEDAADMVPMMDTSNNMDRKGYVAQITRGTTWDSMEIRTP